MDKNYIIKKIKVYKETSQHKDKIKEIGLFGSYAKGNSTIGRDIDIFIKHEPARMFDLISIKNDLEKILGKKVDIIALRKSMNQYLKNQITQHGIYV